MTNITCGQQQLTAGRKSRTPSFFLVVGIFGLLIWQLMHEWRNLPSGFFENLGIHWVLGSLFALVPALLLVSLRWVFTLRALGELVNWWTAIRIWFVSQAGRYLPGGVWNYVARFHLAEQAKISRGTAVTSIVLETWLRVISEILVFVLSSPFWPDKRFLTLDVAILLTGGVVLGLVFLHPALLQRFSRLQILRRAGLEMSGLSALKCRTILALLLYYASSVVLVGWAFFLLVAAFYPVSLHLLPVLVGSLALSVVLGFLTPLVPNGWGVREGVLAFLLSQIMPLSVSIVIAVAARVWLTIGEAVWILVAIGTLKYQAVKYPTSGID